MILTTVTPEYRGFLNKLRERKGWSYKKLAREMGTPENLMELRERQLEHFFSPSKSEKRGPSAAFAKAVEEAFDITLTARDYGWDPTRS